MEHAARHTRIAQQTTSRHSCPTSCPSHNTCPQTRALWPEGPVQARTHSHVLVFRNHNSTTTRHSREFQFIHITVSLQLQQQHRRPVQSSSVAFFSSFHQPATLCTQPPVGDCLQHRPIWARIFVPVVLSYFRSIIIIHQLLVSITSSRPPPKVTLNNNNNIVVAFVLYASVCNGAHPVISSCSGRIEIPRFHFQLRSQLRQPTLCE